MGHPEDTASKKSTNVRSFLPPPSGTRLLRLGFQALQAVAPEAAERWAARLFFQPRRGRAAARLRPAGLEPNAFNVTVGDQRVAGWSWGEGPVVLLVHGWEGRAAQLMPFVAPLVAAGHRVVAFDQPAHGESSGRTVTVVDMARAIARVAEAVGPVHAIVAHSLGGAAAALALDGGLDVARVVLLAPAAEPAHFARALAAIAGLSKARTDGMLRKIGARLDIDLEAFSFADVVRRLRAPALVIHDPADREVPWSHGRSIAAAWPRAQLEAVTGVGHRRILRDARVIELAVKFIRGDAASILDGRAQVLQGIG
ncbi:MAG TPA: alpha/beta fold hydrolase [Polyangia bacterium]|nr:alpha/beta fold hydrolase [Polyangia bacterium]